MNHMPVKITMKAFHTIKWQLFCSTKVITLFRKRAWYWCCTTLPHTSTLFQLAKYAKMCCQIHQEWIFLPNSHKIHDILIFVISQGQEWCKILNLATPKVKDIVEFNFHDLKGEGCLGFLFSRSRKKPPWRYPDLILWIPYQPSSDLC